ncbi:MAG: hypothetical protein JNM99_08135 [Verrucomicrobiaceae bacterium]|nr:hypothetical protein [Verrucomicrobiaceae bacterium]
MNRLLIPTLLLSLLLSVTQAQEVRQWTDKATGKQIEASMVSADPKARTVTIQRKDGQSFTLPVDRLVDADLAYIKASLSAPAPAAPAAPAAPGAPPAATPAPTAPKTTAAPAGKPAAPVGAPAPPRPAVVVTPAKKFKYPAGGAILGAVKKVRPRMIYTAEGFAAMKARSASDPFSQKLLASMKATGEKLLELPELVQVRGEAARAGSDPSSKMLFHMPLLAVLNYCEGDPRWKDYAAREMVSVASFTNWHPEEPEICAQFLWSMSWGYDWFHDAMNEEQRKKVRAAIRELGIDALAAHLKGEPLPPTTKRPEPGVTATPDKNPPKGKAKKADDDDGPVSTEEMLMSGALLHAAIALADDEPNTAGPAATLGAKFFGRGIKGFAPDGIWHEGLFSGDKVLDMVASLIMTLRSSSGADFGLSTVEGLPQAGVARMHLTSTNRRDIFNFGDSERSDLSRNWVTSFLASLYGNPGVPAAVAPGPQSPDGTFMGMAGLMLYHNPHIAGYGTADTLDAGFAGAQVATLRSSWTDPKGYFVALKGGDNSKDGAQLDLGTFVLDAGGVRWGIELGAEGDRAPGMSIAATAKKFELYRENTFGQNTWRFKGAGADDDDKGKAKGNAPKGKAPVITVPPGNQPHDATAEIIGFSSTPDKGMALVDLSKAYSRYAKPLTRGVMMVRGPKPFVIMQDELKVKGSSEPAWIMHTRAEVSTNGNKAVLKSGGQTLTVTVLSPAGASIFSEALSDDDKSLKTSEQVGSFKGISILKIPLTDPKGDHTVTVSFSLGEEPPAAAVVPLAQWIPKKK